MNPIEKEYITHIPKITDYINLDELYVYIDYVIDNIDIDIKDLGKEIKLNNKDKLRATIRNFFILFFQEEETEFYDEDNKLLKELMILDNIYIRYFCMIRNIANANNSNELFKYVNALFKSPRL